MSEHIPPGFTSGHLPLFKVARRKKHTTVPSVVPSRKAVFGTYIRVAKPLTADFLCHLETDPDVVKISPYPMEVSYEIHDRYGPIGIEKHIVEIGVMMCDGTVSYHDVIPTAIQEEFPNLVSRGEKIRTHLENAFGYCYSIIDELCLHIEPRWQNLQEIRRLDHDDDKPAVLTVRRVLDQIELPTTIGAVRHASALPPPISVSGEQLNDVDRAFAALMRLASFGHIDLDLSKPFGDATVVSTPPQNERS